MYLLKTHTVFNPYIYRELSMKKKFRDFESAREFASSLGLKSKKEWYAYTKSGNKPDNIPVDPRKTYTNEFKGYGDWLGTGSISNMEKVYRPFKEARAFVRKLKLKNQYEWREYCNSGNKPDDIPFGAERTYKNKGWKSVGDWLGTGRIAHQNKQFRPFKEAREFVRELGLKNYKEWNDYCKSGKKPDDIPAHPWDVYKEWEKK